MTTPAPWALYRTPNGPHVVPLGDDVGHELEGACVCGPEEDEVRLADGATVILRTHRALDGRA